MEHVTKWTPAHEMAYWKAGKDDFYYLDNLRQKSLIFNVDHFLHMHYGSDSFNELIAVDIGGGAFGGALRFTQGFGASILVDKLIAQYEEMGKLPKWVETMTADFEKIPLMDNSADVVFAWNVYDYARSQSHFIIGVDEAKRILKPGGLIFASFPMRDEPRNGHPYCIKEPLVERQFHRFDILKRGRVSRPLYVDDTLFIVAHKPHKD